MTDFEQQELKLQKLTPYIGELVIAFADVEDTLDHCLVDLINTNDSDVGWLIIKRMTYSARVDMLKEQTIRILTLSNASQREVSLFKNIISKLKEAGNKRNKIVHAAWSDWDFKTHKVRVGINSNDHGPSRVKMRINKRVIENAIEYTYFVGELLYIFMEEHDLT